MRFHRFRRRTLPVALTAVALTAVLLAIGTFRSAAAAPGEQRTCSTRTSAGTYIAAPGDSWFAIARSAGVTDGSLLQANGASAADPLYPGDVLCLPEGATPPAPPVAPAPPAPVCAATHRVVDGDNWFAIARSAGLTMAAILDANQATTSTVLFVGRDLCLPAGATPTGRGSGACALTYVVERGDSWSAIASSAGVGIGALQTANGASATTVLLAGHEVCLPAGATAVPSADPCASKRTVVDGDSWYALSIATGVPLPALYEANDATANTALFVGAQVCLPEVGFGRDQLAGLIRTPPVRGACGFANSFAAARPNGRTHQGIDLIATTGTPVVAVATGKLSRQISASSVSGNAWYLTTSNFTYVFYAHLSAFAPGLAVGDTVTAGTLIGYVGSTGNATSPHLHFEIHPYGGGAVNPYDTIWMLGGCDFDIGLQQSSR